MSQGRAGFAADVWPTRSEGTQEARFMFEDRNQRVDLLALVLLAVTVFLALSLISYSPTDPIREPIYPVNLIYQPDSLVYPVSESIGNWCGHLGAISADILLRALGVGAYFVVVSLVGLVGFMLLGRDISAPVMRIFGWFLTLIGFTTLVSIALPAGWPGPSIGPGGYIGALGQGILSVHFATIGGLVLAISVTLFGLMLCTDYFLFQLAVSLGVAGFGRSMPRRRKPKLAASDVEEEPGMSVRIRGKRVDSTVEDEWEDQEEEEYEDGEEEVDELEDDEEAYDEEEESVDDEEPSETVEPVRSGLRRLMGRAAPSLKVRKAPDKNEQNEREEVMDQLDEASRREETRDYALPTIDLLLEADDFCFDEQEKEVRRKARILEKTFKNFGFQVKVVEIETGPVIAQYEVELEAGLRLSKITGLADDVAIALRVPSVRIVAPIPGKNTVGIEVPNEERQVVRLREVMDETNGRINKMRIPLFLGKDVSGNPLTVDLSTLPHLLIAGRTGTGKSVCLNAIISSILMTRRPDEVRMLMIDPKMVELSGYKTLPHLMHPVVTDMRKAEAILAWAVDKMEERYELLARAGVRHISGYNQLGEEELMDRLDPDDAERPLIPSHLPYIVIVADEMADLMMTAGKEVEQHIIRLAQKSRAVGIHLILATQKPTVDVITGLIKSNLPARIAFQVASRTDSRVVLDEMGADKLLGNGDMLFLWPGTSSLLRGQGTFLSDDEINSVVESVSTGEQNFVKELVQLKVEAPPEGGQTELKKRDDLYESAVDIVIREGRGSVSLLQRCLGIGYGRAARLIDFMAEDGIVGPYNGSQAREVVMSLEDWQQLQSGGETAESEGSEDANSVDTESNQPSPSKKRRSNKIIPFTTDPQPESGPEEASFEEEAEEENTYESEPADEYEDGEVDEYEEEEYETEEYEYDKNALEEGEAEEFDDEDHEDEEYEEEEEEYEHEEDEYEEEDEEEIRAAE